MKAEKILQLCGKKVGITYCAATENLYEDLSNQSISVFVPEQDGEKTIPPKAKIGDILMLAYAGILAFYARRQEDVPITSNEVLYDVTAQERNELLTAIVQLRAEWYQVSDVIKETNKKEGKTKKNA